MILKLSKCNKCQTGESPKIEQRIHKNDISRRKKLILKKKAPASNRGLIFDTIVCKEKKPSGTKTLNSNIRKNQK